MQDHNVMHVPTLPIVKLAQSNMELLTRFSSSPEVSAQANASAQQFFQQATESATRLMHSGAYAHLLQGMLKNYTLFLTELSESSLALMSQGQAAMTRQVQGATEAVADASETRGRRTRQTA